MIYCCFERFTRSKITLYFSKMWTLLVCGVLLTICHSTQQMQIHGNFMKESKNYTTTIKLAWIWNRVDSIKYLGLTIKDNLSWSDHISKICSKARRLIGILFRQFYKCADTSTIRTLYLTLIRPHLEYAIQIWDPYLIKDCKFALLEDVLKFSCN